MKNFTFKVVGEASVRLFSSLFVLLLARFVGAAEFGRYSSAFAFASIFTIFVDLGTGAIVTREIARHSDRQQHILHTTHSLKVLSALGALLLIHFLSPFFAVSKDKTTLVDALGVVVITYTLLDYFCSMLTGKEDMKWEALLKVVCRGIIFLIGIGAILIHASLAGIGLSMAAGAFVSYGIGVQIVRYRFGSFHYEIQLDTLRFLLRSCLPLFGSVFFWAFYDNQDVLLLNHFRVPDNQIGYFAAAIKMIDVLKVYPVLLVGVFFPSLSRLSLGHSSDFLKRAHRLMRFMGVSAFPLALLIYVLAPFIMVLLYGESYSSATPLLRNLLPAFLGISLNHLFMHVLIARDQEGTLFVGSIIACLSNLLMSWVLIPLYGSLGVCYALVGSELMYSAFQGYLVHRTVPGFFSLTVFSSHAD